MRKRRASRGLAVLAAAAWASEALGQAATPTVTIGRIESQKACTLYQQSAGKAALAITPGSIRASASWRTWMVRDCIENFASIRTSLEAALAGSGKVHVVPGGGKYTVTGRISDSSGNGGPAPEAPDMGDGFSISTSNMAVNMDLSLRDAAGRTIYGGLYTTRMETGSDVKVGNFYATSSKSGQALYTELQHAVALTAARMIAFRITPLRVTGASGRTIRLNYGAPLLGLGMSVQAASPDGMMVIRYNVTSAGPGSALAELDGDGDTARILPGSIATVIEADDPAANGRRYRKVDLP